MELKLVVIPVVYFTDLNCRFIENSVVEVEKTANVERSVISSVYVQDTLNVGIINPNSKVLSFSTKCKKLNNELVNVGGANSQTNYLLVPTEKSSRNIKQKSV